MRKPLILSISSVLLALLLSPVAHAELFKLRGGIRAKCATCDAKDAGNSVCDKCNSGAGCNQCLGADCCGQQRWRDRRRYDGQDPSSNCGCNGSYKFPVPPLYTYHWPGLYAQTLTTDYQGPWRFPPIRPYTEDVRPQAKQGVRQVAYPKPSGSSSSRFVPLSERMKRYYR